MKFILNLFTYSRILLTPLIIYLIVEGDFLLSGILFAYCSFSDIADGKIARKYNLVSSHGNYMDPFADKVLMIGTLCSLLFLKSGCRYLPNGTIQIDFGTIFKKHTINVQTIATV